MSCLTCTRCHDPHNGNRAVFRTAFLRMSFAHVVQLKMKLETMANQATVYARSITPGQLTDSNNAAI